MAYTPRRMVKGTHTEVADSAARQVELQYDGYVTEDEVAPYRPHAQQRRHAHGVRNLMSLVHFKPGRVIDGGNGIFLNPVSHIGSPPSRPDAVTAGEGAQCYDHDLKLPLWSNGTVWKDAAGTTRA